MVCNVLPLGTFGCNMLFAIDAGNTNIVFALFEGDDTKAIWRNATDAKKTADDFAVWLQPLFDSANLAFKNVQGAIISSVVPSLDYNLKQLCKKHFNVDATVVEYGTTKLNFDIKLPQPEQLGADRIVNTVAINAFYCAPAIVIDFGTATTFDMLDQNGDYIGGVIAPGPNLSLEALYRAAAKLPPIDLARPARVMGNDTISAMQSGVYYGYVGLIEGLIARLKCEFGAAMTVIATGGLAVLFKESIAEIDIFDADLTLKGLKVLYEMNNGLK